MDCLDAEYENPELVIGLLGKFSRKLVEPNGNHLYHYFIYYYYYHFCLSNFFISLSLSSTKVFSKLKALLSVHKLVQRSDEPVKNAIMKTVASLRDVIDKKSGKPFFSMDSIEESSSTASNVAELHAADFASNFTFYILLLLLFLLCVFFFQIK